MKKTCNGSCHCGVHPFDRGHIEEMGGDFVSIQWSTLDDVLPAELLQGPMQFADGRDNNWWVALVNTRHL
ncbi:hypothetical protein [Curvibacter delicatus]|jgi:hypothetical protein|uniref:hypothetical protein n=1 Tax=Curvibacter delicatus TaxID=80879 RepID=UPI000AA8C703|nr:hypothetical protein [Curvibacter delicatus]